MGLKKLLSILLLLLPGSVWAAVSGVPLDRAPINPSNNASLQRGAALFVNYCMGCHSAEHQRYSRFARDAGLPEELVTEHLIFDPNIRVGDLMTSSMTREDGARWFGAAPPDLTLIARARGVDYLYTFLRTFYLDDGQFWGVNNAAFPQTGMPHVLWQLQGWRKPVYQTVNGEATDHIVGFELVEPGLMTPAEFDSAMADLVNFLAYIAEPIRLERQRIGLWVLLYLALAFVVFYLLKKEYWKDVH